MNTFIQKFSHVIKGFITGFDRIVFKGSILPLMHERGAMDFCSARGILNKDYKDWVQEQTKTIIDDAAQYAEAQCGRPIKPFESSKIRKEEEAHGRQREDGIESGLIGVWSAVEMCGSYKARYCAASGFPQLKREWTKCKHLYFYFDHEEFGFMNIRLQTWFPYHIQFALNGREWLRRSLEREGCGFMAKGNKFLHVDDFDKAQQLLNRQLDARWDTILGAFLPQVFPAMKSILGPNLGYYWTLWQSEWATDLIFPSAKDIAPVADSLLRHAFMTGCATNVLRYLDRPITKDGKPHARMNNEVASRMMDFNDGVRVRHWVDHNSVKIYNELNNLRIETTINQPGMFQVHRHAQGESASAPKRRMGLRKGVADAPLRTQVSQEVNNRFMEQMATCSDETPAREIIKPYCKPKKKDARRVRAIDPTGKDLDLLQAVSDPAFTISGITNKALREKLAGKPGYAGKSDKQLSAKISRQLRLLRDHGLIKKTPRQKKYQLTMQGQKLTTTLNAFLAASTKQLMKIAA